MAYMDFQEATLHAVTPRAYNHPVEPVIQKPRDNRSSQELMYCVWPQAELPTKMTVTLNANESLCLSQRAAAGMCLL